MAIDVTNSAWRSRWMTCVARRTGVRPSFLPTICSIFGSMFEYVPTAPESLQTETIFLACSMRSMSRSISALQSRSLRPNVIGSAWMPCVRPMHGVCLNSFARRRRTSRNFLRSSRMIVQASRIIMQYAVSLTSEDVRPLWMYLESSPTFSATFVRNAMMSWCVTDSISWMRLTSNFAFARMFLAASFGISPSSAMASQAAISTFRICCHSFSIDQRWPISGLV